MTDDLRFGCTMCYVCIICGHTLCRDSNGRSIDDCLASLPLVLCPLCKEQMEAVL